MTTEQKKKFLMQYRHTAIAVRSIEDEIAELRSHNMGSAISSDGQPRGTNIKDLSDYAARLDQLERNLIKKKKELIRTAARIERAIEKMPNERYQALLRDRYINGKKWEEIAGDYGYDDVRGIYMMHGRALKEFKC